MELGQYFKSIIDQDSASVVICDLDHTIIYLNSAAIKSYEKRGGSLLLGKSLLDCHNNESKKLIIGAVEWFKRNEDNNILHEAFDEKKNRDQYMVALRDETGKLIGYYEKHEYRDRDMTPFMVMEE